MHIKALKPEDYSAAAAVHEDAFHGSDVSDYLCEYTFNEGVVIGAYDHDELVGFAMALTHQDSEHVSAHIHILAVKPSHTGQHIGSALVETMCAVLDVTDLDVNAEHAFVAKTSVDIFDTTPASIHLHEKFGFARQPETLDTYSRTRFSHILDQGYIREPS